MNKILLIAMAIVIAGCSGYQIKGDVNDDFSKRNIGKTTFPPTKAELTSGRHSVLVMRAEVEPQLAKKANLKKMVSSQIENLLQESKINIIDRSKAKQLSKELRLAEIKGKSQYKGEQISDYVMIPHITETTFSRNFKEAYTTQDKEGKTYRHAARCVYGANVSGFIEVYKMPALTSFARITIEDYTNTSTETRSSDCPYSKNDINALVVKASKEAISKKKASIKNLFPPKGHVLEMRMDEEGKVIIKTTLGLNRGAKPKNKIIIKQKRSEPYIDNEVVFVDESVGEGVVSDKLFGPYSWVVLNNKKSRLGEIRVGDTVYIQYKKNWWDIAKETTNKASEALR